jgi:hypothetical protein
MRGRRCHLVGCGCGCDRPLVAGESGREHSGLRQGGGCLHEKKALPLSMCFLCLSQACLGKLIISIFIKMGKNRFVFLPLISIATIVGGPPSTSSHLQKGNHNLSNLPFLKNFSNVPRQAQDKHEETPKEKTRKRESCHGVFPHRTVVGSPPRRCRRARPPTLSPPA